jgi:AcrR family transcriptional regulator
MTLADPLASVASAVGHLQELQARRPSSIRQNDLSTKGAGTYAAILAAARTVFERDGHAGLSLRKVASEAGIAVGNVNYYFPAREALVEAMLREALGAFVEHHLAQLATLADDPLTALLDIIVFYVEDARRSHPLFMQMWGYAASGPKERELIRELYRPIGRLVRALVVAARPDADVKEVREIVLQLFSLEEGVKMFIALGPDDDPAIASAEDHIRDLARRIVLGRRA